MIQYLASMPDSAKAALAGIVAKYIADGIKKAFANMDGRRVHVLVAVIAAICAVAQAVTMGNPTVGPMVSNAVVILASAIGFNELTKPASK